MAKFITNQNIEIKLELASIGDRMLAFLLDALILFAYFMLVVIISESFSGFSSLFLMVAMLPMMFYSLLFEIFYHGQSPGKKARNLRVVRLDGGAPSIGHYLLRWVLRPVDIFFYGAVAILTIIVTKNGQRLGDLAAGTTVIRLRQSINLSEIRSVRTDQTPHEVLYPQVKRLSDRQIELIRRSLKMRRDGHNADAVHELALKIKEVLHIDEELPDVKFLYQILADYEYIHQ
ncbi:MAG: RDD family protein [Cyclobacteriaceae bacterium]|nr:RDD family protein [Cyclobacteriaceae bacterium]